MRCVYQDRLQQTESTVTSLRNQLRQAREECATAKQRAATDLQQHMAAQQQLISEVDGMKVGGADVTRRLTSAEDVFGWVDV